MKKTVSRSKFIDDFKSIRPENFSYAGLNALFDYMEEMEEDTGEEIELDVIGICCNFSEYSTALEAAQEYGFKPEEDDDKEEQESKALEYLRENTTVIEFDGGIIVQGF